MATQKSIVYTVDLDTAQAQAQLNALMAGQGAATGGTTAGASNPPPQGGASGGAAPATPSIPLPGGSGGTTTSAGGSGLPGVVGAVGGSAAAVGTASAIAVVSAAAFSVVKEMMHGAQTIAGASISGATGSNPVGTVGAIAGGLSLGLKPVIGALSQLTESAMNAARTLSYFDGAIFTAMTRFDLAVTGFQFIVAKQLSPQFTELIYQVQRLLGPLSALVVSLGQLILPLLSSFTKYLHDMVIGMVIAVEYLKLLGSALFDLSKYIFDLIIYASTMGIGPRNSSKPPQIGASLDKFGTLYDDLKDNVNTLLDNGKGLEIKGAEINYALLGMVAKFAYQKNASGYGPQTTLGGFILDRAPNAPMLRGGSPTEQAIDRAKMKPGELPKAAPAAINLRVADTIQFNIEEDRMIQEMQMWQQDMMAKLDNAIQMKWHKIRSASYVTNAGILR